MNLCIEIVTNHRVCLPVRIFKVIVFMSPQKTIMVNFKQNAFNNRLKRIVLESLYKFYKRL